MASLSYGPEERRRRTARPRKTTLKQLELLRQDIRHPSIHAKKYEARNDVWQGRVNRDYRFYFRDLTLFDSSCRCVLDIQMPLYLREKQAARN